MNQRAFASALSISLLALTAVRCASSSGSSAGQTSTETSGDGGVIGAIDAGSGSSSGATATAEAGTDAAGDSGSGAGEAGPGGPGATGGARSVLQRGNDVFRRATFTASGLSKAMVPTMKPDTTFDTNAVFPMNGSTQNQGTASVLYLEQGPPPAGCPAGATGCMATARPANGGLFFAFPALGSNPNIVAFDETTGLPVWTAQVMSGGDGIRGTPVIDAASRRLFVVTGGDPHVVHALAVDTGAEATTGGWPVTLSKTTLSYNGTAFNSADENQHGALLLVNGILYIPFGGHYGDGGSYRGWIVAIDIANPTHVAGWATQSPRSGIWGSGGLASDGTSVFGVTGDTTSEPRSSSDSQQVVRLSGMAQLTRSAANVFVPVEWQSWDKPMGDLDFGASTPSYVPLPPGSSPAALLVAPAKAGTLFVLDATNLSGGKYPAAGGSLGEFVVADTTGESVYTAPTIYTSASGLHATINVGQGPANCPGGTKSSTEMVISMLLQPGQTPIAREVWCAPNSGGGHTNYPPISTTTDGASADALVWFMSGSQLTAVDGDTGAKVMTTSGAACDSVPSMSFPIAVKDRVVVSALGHLCSWSVSGP
jgi:hypothetical protein